MAVLDIFLGIVPRPSPRRHGNGDEQTCDDDAKQHRAERREGGALAGDQLDDEVEHDRRQNRQERWYEHLLDGGAGKEINRLAIVWPVGALHDAWLLSELTP